MTNAADETARSLRLQNCAQPQAVYRRLRRVAGDVLLPGDYLQVRRVLAAAALSSLPPNGGPEKASPSAIPHSSFLIPHSSFPLQTALICAEEIEPSRASLISILISPYVEPNDLALSNVRRQFGEDVERIVRGLARVAGLYEKNASIATENFRQLLISFAEDMRVVFIIIAERVNLMRQLKDRGTDEDRRRIATEAKELYAPLAHKLGLYLIKSELEDLSLKYLEHDAYYHIKEKLAQTKRARDLYIARFIQPVEEKLQAAGLRFHIKGRTKSIHSIWQKMKKQKCPFEGVYDLFAIRVILDSAPEKEKTDCWLVYGIVTDMYRPNPRRLRDWLSVPKSNGYESLHTTVMGPEGRWVEVQIRTERMDEIAEHGLAAHWRYKGVKESGAKEEDFLALIRQALENHATDGEMLLDQFKVELYSDEVFVFSPKGDLYKLQKGATVLDFAYAIHTNVGYHCAGGKVNGKNVPIRTRLQSGDQVEILTQPNQAPKRDWLTIAHTSKARTKIRQALNEQEQKAVAFAKEAFERRLKNRKIDIDESLMMKLLRQMGYKHVNDFYRAIGEEQLDINTFVERYVEAEKREQNQLPPAPAHHAEEFSQTQPSSASLQTGEEGQASLLIDGSVKGVEYSLAKCCNPIYGDPVFGFVTIGRGIKVHRQDCPNARRMRDSHAYRIIPARWVGKAGALYPVTLHIVGRDDIGIVNNITSIIAKHKNTVLRSIDIKSSEDGLFSGSLTLQIDDLGKLKTLLGKLKEVKGVKQVSR